MKVFKIITLVTVLIATVSITNAQNSIYSSDKENVVAVMKLYKDAIQNLTTEGTFELFAPDATIFEQGKIEGTYNEYISHHLGPELEHFKSFTFSDYEIQTTINLPFGKWFWNNNYFFTLDGFDIILFNDCH